MSSWASGYVADLGYTHGFYRELTPSFLSFVALTRGQNGPDANAPLHYCELGCGQGFSMNLLAAANPHIQFHATDFNPSQISGARTLAQDAKLDNVKFYDTSFSVFADQPGLPEEFDIISLHGIYSWVNADLRAAIVDFLDRKLKVGGLVYVSYNCLPGWSAAAPMRHLMHLKAKTEGGPTAQRVQPALDFVERIQQAGAAYFRAVPGLADRLSKLNEQSRNYLAHEYFNDSWDLFYHSDVVNDLEKAKLSFLGSATLLEQVDAVSLTADQQKIMAKITDPVLRETVRDFMMNQQFRRDVFVKGPVPLSPRTAQERWLDQRFALSVKRADIELKVKCAIGDATLQAETYNPLLDKLASGPKTMRELIADPTIAKLGWGKLREATLILSGIGHLQPCLSSKDDALRKRSLKSFNKAVMQRAQDNADLQFLASPVTGSGVNVGRFPQLFLLAIDAGHKQPEDWAKFAWALISKQGQKLIKDGKTLDAAEDNISELLTQAKSFAEKQWPILQQLEVVA